MRRRDCSAALSSYPSLRTKDAISRQLKDTPAAPIMRNIRASSILSIGPRAVSRRLKRVSL